MPKTSAVTSISGFLSTPKQVLWEYSNGDKNGVIDKSDDLVNATNDASLYPMSTGSILVNRVGNRVGLAATVRINSSGGVNVNFKNGEGCLAAEDFPEEVDRINAPLTLQFGTPVRGLGAYVSVLGARSTYYAERWDLTAILHVDYDDGSSETTARETKPIGRRLAQDQRVTAPFAGCQVESGSRRIKVAYFDASSIFWFRSIIISRLYWID